MKILTKQEFYRSEKNGEKLIDTVYYLLEDNNIYYIYSNYFNKSINLFYQGTDFANVKILNYNAHIFMEEKYKNYTLGEYILSFPYVIKMDENCPENSIMRLKKINLLK